MSRPKKVLTIEVYRHSNHGGYSIMKHNHETDVEIGGPVDEKTRAEIEQMLEELT